MQYMPEWVAGVEEGGDEEGEEGVHELAGQEDQLRLQEVSVEFLQQLRPLMSAVF